MTVTPLRSPHDTMFLYLNSHTSQYIGHRQKGSLAELVTGVGGRRLPAVTKRYYGRTMVGLVRSESWKPVGIPPAAIRVRPGWAGVEGHPPLNWAAVRYQTAAS